jgi:hypothetical protein
MIRRKTACSAVAGECAALENGDLRDALTAPRLVGWFVPPSRTCTLLHLVPAAKSSETEREVLEAIRGYGNINIDRTDEKPVTTQDMEVERLLFEMRGEGLLVERPSARLTRP